MISSFRLSKIINQPVTLKINSIKRYLSGKPTNEPTTNLHRSFLKERKYVMPIIHVAHQDPVRRTCTNTCEAFNYWLNIPIDKMNEIWYLSDSVHNVLILVDDLLDNSILRRKFPSANTIFGTTTTIASLTMIQSLITDAALKLGHPDAVKIVNKHLFNGCKGLAMEVYWYENKYVPTEEEMEECLLRKVSSSVWGQASLMQLFSENKCDLLPFLKCFGVYHQILDDYNDLGIQNVKNNIMADDDITAGQYTYPIVHALRTNPDDYQIHRILELRTRDINIKRHFLSLLEKSGSLEYTRNTINRLEQQVRGEIEKLGGNPHFTKIMDGLNSKFTNI